MQSAQILYKAKQLVHLLVYPKSQFLTHISYDGRVTMIYLKGVSHEIFYFILYF
jgi:hypothetical protein